MAPLIGILAGMGPDSTAPFLEMVVAECRTRAGASRDEDFPAMLVLSWPTPFRPDRPTDHEALEEAIGRGLDLLAASRPALVAIPCNTAHLYLGRLRERVEAPVIDMVAAAVEELPPAADRVALLATRATRDAGIYQARLEEAGKTPLAPEPLQQVLDAALAAAKRDPAAGDAVWVDVLAELADLEAQLALIACTDLTPLAARRPPEGLPVLDATRVLAARLVERWMELRA